MRATRWRIHSRSSTARSLGGIIPRRQRYRG
jgi:hypothetical protein